MRSQYINKDIFRLWENDEDLCSLKVPYLSIIDILMYLANSRGLDIAFVEKLLAIFSSSPIRWYWNGDKHVVRYFHRTIDLILFYLNKTNPNLIQNTNVSYIFDPHKTCS